MGKKTNVPIDNTYDNFCSNAEFIQIFVRSMKFERFEFPEPDAIIQLKTSGKPEACTYKYDDDLLIVNAPMACVIKTINKKDKGDNKNVFTMKLVLEMIFSSKHKINDDIFKKFAEHNLPSIFTPFLREILHNGLTRAGLPAFMLPIYFAK